MHASNVQSAELARADAVLLERIVARDETAIAALYDRHSRLLFGLILRILRDRGEAEEVLQEVFLAVWSRAQSYDAAMGSPAAWLVGIARHRGIDRLRALAVRVRTLDRLDGSPVAADNPETSAVRSQGQERVLRALDLLPAEQRQLIEHAYFLGLTHSELATRFGLPLGTVKTRVRSGMIALRAQLSDYE